jgi:hypothetical protein
MAHSYFRLLFAFVKWEMKGTMTKRDPYTDQKRPTFLSCNEACLESVIKSGERPVGKSANCRRQGLVSFPKGRRGAMVHESVV